MTRIIADGRSTSARGADHPPGALGSVEVAGRRDDGDRVDVDADSSSAIRARISSSRWPPSVGRAPTTDTCARSTAQPASAAWRTASLDQLGAGDARASRIGRRKQPAEVAQRRTPTRIAVASGVQHDVAVGVAVEPRRVLDQRRRRATGHRPARSRGCPRRSRSARLGACRAAMARTSSRSPGSVTLMLSGSPGTVATGTPLLSSSAGLVA